MNKIILGFSLGFAMITGVSHAQVDLNNQLMRTLTLADIAHSQANLLNWKVGDFHKINIKFVFGGGTGKKEVTKEEKSQNAVWLVTTMNLMGQNQKTEALYDRATAKVLKLIVNGKEQEVGGEDGEIEIIEQKETEVTVPAGKFDCMYIKAKTNAQGQETTIEAFINPIDVNIDGMLKMILGTQFGPLTLELASFGPKN
jgi:hypothetical protein